MLTSLRRAVWAHAPLKVQFRFSRGSWLDERRSWFRVVATELGFELPERYVETGTYHLESLKDAVREERFTSIHTIDLEPRFVGYASALWAGLRSRGAVDGREFVGHVGDSATQLAQHFLSDRTPTLFYLDAHFSGGATAFGQEECPLLRELEVLAERNVPGDIVVVDDIRLFGFTGTAGIAESDVYPEFQTDWSGITLDKVRELYGEQHTYVKWPDHCLTASMRGDLSEEDMQPTLDRLIIFEAPDP